MQRLGVADLADLLDFADARALDRAGCDAEEARFVLGARERLRGAVARGEARLSMCVGGGTGTDRLCVYVDGSAGKGGSDGTGGSGAGNPKSARKSARNPNRQPARPKFMDDGLRFPGIDAPPSMNPAYASDFSTALSRAARGDRDVRVRRGDFVTFANRKFAGTEHARCPWWPEQWVARVEAVRTPTRLHCRLRLYVEVQPGTRFFAATARVFHMTGARLRSVLLVEDAELGGFRLVEPLTCASGEGGAGSSRTDEKGGERPAKTDGTSHDPPEPPLALTSTCMMTRTQVRVRIRVVFGVYPDGEGADGKTFRGRVDKQQLRERADDVVGATTDVLALRGATCVFSHAETLEESRSALLRLGVERGGCDAAFRGSAAGRALAGPRELRLKAVSAAVDKKKGRGGCAVAVMSLEVGPSSLALLDGSAEMTAEAFAYWVEAKLASELDADGKRRRAKRRELALAKKTGARIALTERDRQEAEEDALLGVEPEVKYAEDQYKYYTGLRLLGVLPSRFEAVRPIPTKREEGEREGQLSIDEVFDVCQYRVGTFVYMANPSYVPHVTDRNNPPFVAGQVESAHEGVYSIRLFVRELPGSSVFLPTELRARAPEAALTELPIFRKDLSGRWRCEFDMTPLLGRVVAPASAIAAARSVRAEPPGKYAGRELAVGRPVFDEA
jgi:hypothetical protein